MPLRQRRVFISYSRKRPDLRDALAEWLRARDFEPVYDDAPEEPRKVLTVKVADMIRGADCVIALGTRESLGSKWVEEEVEYAAGLRGKPHYVPVLAEAVPEDELPAWFLRKRPLVGGFEYVECPGGNYSALARPLEQLRRGFRVTLGAAVGIALALFLVVPLLLWWVFEPIVDSAGGDVRAAQLWVEKLNAGVEENDPALGREVTRQDDGGVREVEYRDRATRALLVHDTFESRSLVRRRFFRAGRDLALDTVATLRAPNGAVSQVKMRRISPRGPDGPIIEDLFDSDGKLVSKRMRSSAREPWRYFAERGRTQYAVYPFIATYR